MVSAVSLNHTVSQNSLIKFYEKIGFTDNNTLAVNTLVGIVSELIKPTKSSTKPNIILNWDHLHKRSDTQPMHEPRNNANTQPMHEPPNNANTQPINEPPNNANTQPINEPLNNANT